MTRPIQPDLFSYAGIVAAVIAEVNAPAARTYELPPDYGTETDWTPVEIPEWLWLPTDGEKRDA